MPSRVDESLNNSDENEIFDDDEAVFEPEDEPAVAESPAERRRRERAEKKAGKKAERRWRRPKRAVEPDPGADQQWTADAEEAEPLGAETDEEWFVADSEHDEPMASMTEPSEQDGFWDLDSEPDVAAPEHPSRKQRRELKRRRKAEEKARAAAERERAKAEREAAGEARRSEEQVAEDGTIPPSGFDQAEQEAIERLREAEGREEAALFEASVQEAEADSERRVREVENIQRVAEARVAEAGLQAQGPLGATEPEADTRRMAPFDAELEATDAQIARRQERDRALAAELERTESSINTSKELTERALAEAAQRLEQIEAQAGEAEERAARAEELAELKQQEVERERRLHEMLERINEAERRARDAERRAHEAVVDVARPIEAVPPPEPLPPEPELEPLPGTAAAPASSPTSSGPQSGTQQPAPSPDADADQGVTPITGQIDSTPVSLNNASFEQLREVGLSVTQTGRVLAYRERTGGFGSLDELSSIPGFPQDFLDKVKGRLSA